MGHRNIRLDWDRLWEPAQGGMHLCLMVEASSSGKLIRDCGCQGVEGRPWNALGMQKALFMNTSEGQWRIQIGSSHINNIVKHTRKRPEIGTWGWGWSWGVPNPSYPRDDVAMTAISFHLDHLKSICSPCSPQIISRLCWLLGQGNVKTDCRLSGCSLWRVAKWWESLAFSSSIY